MIKVIIVDDHVLFRLGIRTAIELRHPDIVITGEAGSGGEFFNLLKMAEADIALLDIILPDMSGINIARRMKTEYPEVRILAVSAENTTATVQEMLDIGINGFVSKVNTSADTLADAIRSVYMGLDYFGKDIAEIINRIYIAKKRTKQISEEFSEYERRIIECCFEGLSGKLIADRLCISLRTVDWHKSNIFRKLGINSTLEMVQFAVKNGIIRIE